MPLLLAPVRITEQWTVKPSILHRRRGKVDYWTESEIALAIKMYNAGKPFKEIQKAIPTRTAASIRQKLQAIRHDQEIVNGLI